MSHTKLIYHLVFGTKNRKMTITQEYDRKLYAYMYGTMKNDKAHVHWIGGMPDHVHVVVEIPPVISVADFVKVLKRRSGVWLKEQPEFPDWEGWAEGYAAFSCSADDLSRVVDYAKRQKEHHCVSTFREEYIKFLQECGLDYDEQYLP